MSIRYNQRKVLAVLILGLTSLGAIGLARTWGQSAPRGVAALAAASPTRPVAGRLSGGVPYAPFVPPGRTAKTRKANRSPAPQISPEALARMRVAAALFAADVERPTARSRGDVGAAHLYDGNPREAVEQLRRAGVEAPHDARLQSDLAVAELALASETGACDDLFAALEASGRALRAGPQIPEVLFNRALVLEALHLSRGARLAWDAYLQLDSVSDWASEARSHSAALSAPDETAQWEAAKRDLRHLAEFKDANSVWALVTRFPGYARVYARDELFAEWAEAIVAQDLEKADRALFVCQTISDVLERLHNDRFLPDAIQAVKSVGSLLVEPHRALRRGQLLFDKQEISAAHSEFEQARMGFARANDRAFEAYADLALASCDFLHYRFGVTLRAVRGVREVARQREYPTLLGRTWWIEGTVQLRRSSLRDAVYAYQTAIPLFARTEEWESYSHVSVALAGPLDTLGRTHAAYTHWITMLENLTRVSSTYRRVWLLSGIAQSLARNQRTWLALDFVQEAMYIAVAAKDARVIPVALFIRGGIYRELGEVDQARSDLAEASRQIEHCPDQMLREEMYANTLLSQAALDLAEDPTQAIASLDRACSFIDTSRFHYLSEEAHLLRARARRGLGDLAGAEQDLSAAITEMELHPQSSGYGHSLACFDDPEALYNDMVALQFNDRRRPDLAFRYADAARSPRLRDEMHKTGHRATPLLTTGQIKQQIPAGVTLVEYAILADRMFIWVIRSGKFTPVEQSVGKVEIDTSIKALWAKIQEAAPIGETLAEAARLYELLVRPIEALIPEADRVVIVPSGPLLGLPFAALYDAQRQRYFIQAHALSLAPSAYLYLAATSRAKQLAGGAPSSALIVGNPAVNRQFLPEFAPLPGAEVEAITIAGIYPSVYLLTGQQAIKERFLSAGNYEIVHFAGHALTSDIAEFSALLFAASPMQTDEHGGARLFAYELNQIHFTRTRIIVLAGCRTGQIGRSRGEGVAGLVRPLLAAGVPSVVTALWDVDDTAALTLSVRLHKMLREGSSAADALRRAQLALIESPDARLRSPWIWASFQVIGSG